MKNFLLAKFGQHQHIIELQKLGKLHCNPLQYFVNVEDDNERADIDENCYELNYFEKGLMKLTPKGLLPISFEMNNARLRQFTTSPVGNLYCLFALNCDNDVTEPTPMYDAKLKDFGSHFLFIKNIPEFINRLKSKLNEMGLEYEMGLIQYSDLSKYSGKKTAFMKDNKYKHQQEFRILIHTELVVPLDIEIGNLEDISKIIEAKEVVLYTAQELKG